MHRLSLIPLAVVLAACEANSPANVSIVTQVDKHVMSTRDTVTVTVDVTNLGLRTVSVMSPQSMCGYAPVEIVTTSEKRVNINFGPCSAMAYPLRELGYSESVRYTLRWTPSMSTIEGAPAGSAGYLFYARVPVNDEVRRMNQGEFVFVQ